MPKEIWLPTTQTKVTVTQEGTVTVWDEMTMERTNVHKPAGFTQPKEAKDKP